MFSETSKSRLSGCDERLQKLFNEVVKYYDCAIICGHRGQADQDKAFHDGFSKVQFPKSKHNSLPSLAVDVCPCPIDWENKEKFDAFAVLVKELAKSLSIDVEWGGDWTDFPDRPHWQVTKET